MFKNVVKEEIIIPAKMSYLPRVRDFIERIGKKHRFSDKIINSFKLVVDEACTNIIRHGYRDVPDGQITIRAIVRRLSWTMVVIDQGISFDPRQVKNPDLEKYVSIGKKGGLGIFMMRKLMDDIKYNVTNRGNELRLTKYRDRVEQPKPVLLWNSLTLRTKFTLGASLVMTLLAIISYIIFSNRIIDNVHRSVFTTAKTLSTNLANISWEPISTERSLVLFENAKSIKESNPELVSMVFITDSNNTVLASYPVKIEIIGKPLTAPVMSEVDTLEQTRVIRYQFAEDSIYFDFKEPVVLKKGATAPIGYTHVFVDVKYIQHLVHINRRNLLLLLIFFLILGNFGIYVLITLIMDPFHKLAGWVRDVGHGTVDEDELDIDASDELGEIAQAFNEMTSKFREAQANLMEQQRIQRELQVAQEIQQMLLPDDFPNVKGYDITSYYQAAKEVGGDLFDFVEVDDHTIGICVADVSGKGVPGSMVMTMIRTALRLEARGNKNPADVLARVNSFITDDIRKWMFVTAFYIILDSRERMISFASAGHNPMILYRGKTKETFYLNPPGFPIGIRLPDIKLFDRTIQYDRIRLHPDDILIIYTDGITEAMNSRRELYGEERFLSAIRRYGHLDVVEFVKKLKEDIHAFTGEYEQNDDITLVAIKENMEAVDVKVNFFRELFERVKNSDITVARACQEFGISPSTYYKYKKIYDEGGYEYLREMVHGYTNLGMRHLSIEVKTKLYDIIRKHPEYGPKRISEQLNTEEYGFTEVSPRLIYEELKRAKLNTRKKREMFVQRGGKQRLKPPGTPLLTLDGEVMIGYRSEDQSDIPSIFKVAPAIKKTTIKERIITVTSKPNDGKDQEKNEDETVEKRNEEPENGNVAAVTSENKRKSDDSLDQIAGESVDE